MRRRAHGGRAVWLAAAAAVAGFAGAVALSTLSGALGRRRMLARGEIRPQGNLWTTVGGCRIYARVAGAAGGAAAAGTLPIVCVHGFGVSSSYFVPSIERLATEFPVYAPDLPGHGKSDTPPEALDVPRLADTLIAWMDAVGIRRASVVANSMGCQTAADAALRYPGRIDRLVLIGPTVDPAGRSVWQLFCRLVASSPFERLSLIGLLVRDYGRMGPRLAAEFRFMRRDRIEWKLPLLRGRACRSCWSAANTTPSPRSVGSKRRPGCAALGAWRWCRGGATPSITVPPSSSWPLRCPSCDSRGRRQRWVRREAV